MGFQITIDGPVGSGKSTIARELAKRLGFIYLDTGAMYRAVGYYILQQGIDISDEEAIEKRLDEIKIDIVYESGFQQIFLNGENISEAIRSQKYADAASKVGAFRAVREKLVALQRQLAGEKDIVMDGRDIGTYVLPDARLKIYLDADPKVRAKRRYDELLQKGYAIDFKEILKDTIERDEYDSNRTHSPLKKPEDAVIIDTGGISPEQLAEMIITLV